MTEGERIVLAEERRQMLVEINSLIEKRDALGMNEDQFDRHIEMLGCLDELIKESKDAYMSHVVEEK